MEMTITKKKEEAFRRYLYDNEKSLATVEKYMRDIRVFLNFLKGREPDRTAVLSYKEHLGRDYAVASANSMLAALNAFFKFVGRLDLCVRQFKVQRKTFSPAERELSREEYLQLIRTAEKKKNERLSLVLQTICGTGIRVSELKYITVEAARSGEVSVSCKGKVRTVFIVSGLQKKLLAYARKYGISSGVLFRTRSGKPINRTSVWREMKSLCIEAGVSPKKVFPHNLRHLFARTFYGVEKDIAKLADILGHSSINTTRIYIIETGVEHRRKMENMRLII